MNDRLAATGARLLRELSAEFPAWRIGCDPAGRWSAQLPGWGTLYGHSAAQLRDRLRCCGGRDVVDDL